MFEQSASERLNELRVIVIIKILKTVGNNFCPLKNKDIKKALSKLKA